MLETLTTLFRARAMRAEEDLIDRNALAILDVQIRDAARALDTSRRALAVAAARDAQERERLQRLASEIADLEERAVAALRDGADALAEKAADAIASLETDRAALAAACETFAGDYARLKAASAEAGRRLADLERGRRMAEAAEAVRRLRAELPSSEAGPSALRRAEATLARLREAQRRSEAADGIYDDLVADPATATVRDELGAAGYGTPTRATAAGVLDRLRARAGAGTSTSR